MPDERIEKAAIAVFAAQTNWTDFNPSEEQIRDLWDGQMDAIHDSFRRLAKAALDSQEDQPADLDWENIEPKVLDSRMVKAVTVDGTIVRGRTVAVHGSLDQLIVEGILQPLLMRLPGEHWGLRADGKVWSSTTKQRSSNYETYPSWIHRRVESHARSPHSHAQRQGRRFLEFR